MESLHQAMGPFTTLRDLVNLEVEETHQIDSYVNNSQNAEMFPMLDEEPGVNTEWGDQYVSANMLLQRGDEMARGQVVCQKQDANGNLIGRSNQYTFFLKQAFTRWNFLRKELLNWKQKSLQIQCMPSVTLIGMSTCY